MLMKFTFGGWMKYLLMSQDGMLPCLRWSHMLELFFTAEVKYWKNKIQIAAA